MRIDQTIPSLFIGLGGAGGEVVGRISRLLKQKWDAEVYEKMARFVVIDTDNLATTNLRQGRGDVGPVNESILISAFNKEEYARLARGDSFKSTDPYFTQWVYPDYKFRAGDSVGAGQIRIESRLGLFRALRTPDLKVRESLTFHIDAMRKHILTLGKSEDMRVHIVFSVAGGTGSGTFLTVAYLVKDIVAKSDLKVNMFGYAIQPHVYRDVVGDNFPDVCANGYASMMELEYCNKVAVQGAKSYVPFEFHYDAPERIGEHPKVSDRPFAMTYLIDVPEKHALNRNELHAAIADIIYMKTITDLSSAQASDVDNYDKYSRALYPEDLFAATKDGFSAFFGSLGMCVLQVPDDDILRYCELRFAASAIRAYMLMDDPAILPKEFHEEFRKCNVPEEELNRLDPIQRKEKMNRIYTDKVEFLQKACAEIPGSFLGGIATVADNLIEKFNEGMEKLVEEAVGGVSLTHLAASSIEDNWMPDGVVQNLFKSTEKARQAVELNLETIKNQIDSWWTKQFLPPLGDPYRQRYALAVLRGYSRNNIGNTAPLSNEKLEEVLLKASKAPDQWRENNQEAFLKSIKEKAEDIRGASRTSFLQRLTKKEEIEERETAARESAATHFNDQKRKIENALKALARGRICKLLATEADTLLQLYIDIERNGKCIAQDLDNKASDYQRTGAFAEKLLDGSLRVYESEANQFAIDEEALMSPTGDRLWDWYYEDQIATMLTGKDQVEQIVAALKEALEPETNEQGIRRPRESDRIIKRIVFEIRDKIHDQLARTITGQAGGEIGLRLDHAMALETLYIKLKYHHQAVKSSQPEEYRAYIRQSLAKYQDGGMRINPNDLWIHPDISKEVKDHIAGKIRKCELVKSDLLSKIDESKVEGLHNARQLLIGIADIYKNGVMGEFLPTNSHVAKEWFDPKRIVFYKYYIGIPVYAYTNINGELKHAYRKHQERGSNRAWYLHTDKNFDNGQIPCLDPMDLRDQVDSYRRMLLPLLFSQKILQMKKQGGVQINDPNLVEATLVSESLDQALKGLAEYRDRYPETYRKIILPFEMELGLIRKTESVKKDDRDLLVKFEKTLVDTLLALEGKAQNLVSQALQNDLRQLLDITRSMTAMKERTSDVVDDDVLF